MNDAIIKEDVRKEDLSDRKREDGLSREKMRTERTPLYVQKAVTLRSRDPNYHYRLVNDLPGRIQRFIEAGWELVQGDNTETYSGKGRSESTNAGTLMTRTVNEDPKAKCHTAYVMRILKTLFDEDQAAKAKRIDDDMLDIDPTGEILKAQMLGSRANFLNSQLNKNKK
jgi:hypothetical protein